MDNLRDDSSEARNNSDISHRIFSLSMISWENWAFLSSIEFHFSYYNNISTVVSLIVETYKHTKV